MPRFQNTTARALASLHAHGSPIPAHSISALRPVFTQQRIERPVGIRDHANPLRSNQDGEIAGCARVLGSFENALRVIDEPAHTLLIDKLRANSSLRKRYQI